MKNKSFLLFLFIATIISSCKKDELINPEVKLENIKPSDKGLMCNCGGGTWDLSSPDFSTETTINKDESGTTKDFVDGKRIRVETPVKPIIPGENVGAPVIPVIPVIPVNPKEN